MKKLILLVLTLMLSFALVACGESSDSDSSDDDANDSGKQESNKDDDDDSSNELFDIPDSDIKAYDTNLNVLLDDEKAAIIALIPAEARKAIGTVGAGLCSVIEQKKDSGVTYTFAFTLKDSTEEQYRILVDYYKSLGGTITTELLDNGMGQLNIDYSWGTLYDCYYGEITGNIQVGFSFSPE